MNEPKPNDTSPADSGSAAKGGEVNSPAPNEPIAPELTKEEQWALFEKELKESDWGHQPC